MNKEQFYRKDYNTSKYFLYCPFSEFKVTKFAHVKNNGYICKIIKIEEL